MASIFRWERYVLRTFRHLELTKNLFQIETELKSNSFVDNVCIVADSNQNYLIALVSPNRSAIEQLARHLGIEELSFHEMMVSFETFG